MSPIARVSGPERPLADQFILHVECITMQNRGMTLGSRGRCQWLCGGEILRLLLGHPAYTDGA